MNEQILALLTENRKNLDRIEALLRPVADAGEVDLDPKSPLNKRGRNLTSRGIEVAYRMYDAGKTRHAVATALEISFPAAAHRHETWTKAGGMQRRPQPLA
jgi:hypothetical protein